MSKITRRSLPALLALVAGAGPTLARAETQAEDPIFPALDAYAQARADYSVASDHLHACAKSERDDAEVETDRAHQRLIAVIDKVLATTPTSHAGALALAGFALNITEQFDEQDSYAFDGLRSVWGYLASMRRA